MIAHVVLFQPKDSISQSAKEDFLSEIRAVARKIAVIQRALVGRTISLAVVPDDLVGRKTYEYSAIFEFAAPKDLSTYLAHPGHDRLRSMFWQFCQATLIADMDLVDPSSTAADKLV